MLNVHVVPFGHGRWESLTFHPCSHTEKGNSFCRNHPVPGQSALEDRPPALPHVSTFVDQQTIFGSIFFPPQPTLAAASYSALSFALFLPHGSQWPMTMYMVNNPPISLQFSFLIFFFFSHSTTHPTAP